ncbi:MAG: M20/M25/M40 family metallo-hydrolase [Gammaproteobacteria bacterium]
MPVASNRGLGLALTGIALLLAVILLAYRPVTPLGADASPTVFSAYRATAILQDLVGDGVPHPLGSPANARVREAIVRKLSALGYATELQSGFVCTDAGTCGSPVNIIATRRGSTVGDGAVLLAAHYDSVPAGPGASDDGTGVAALLEIARILAARPALSHPIVLLITDGEEAGMLGASLFVRDHPLSKRVSAAVNLDARGTSGPSLMFETGSANTWLMGLFASAIARPMTNSLYYVVYKQLDNDTDFTVFKTAGYQGFNFAFIGDVGRYHTPLDNVAHVDAGSVQHHGDNALAALTSLASTANPHPPIAESVFFDGLARTLIAWPTRYTLPAALLALTLLLAEMVILLRSGAVTGSQVLWGFFSTLGMLATGLGLSVAILALGLAVGKVPALSGASWIAHPLPMHLAVAATALLVAGALAAWASRRAGFWGFWVGTALIMAALSVASAVWVPGASYPWLMTVIAAVLGALPCTVSWARSQTPAQWAAEMAALLPTYVFFGAVFPQLQFLYTALGSLAWPVSALVLGLGAASLLPLLAAAPHRSRLTVMGVAATFVVGGTLAAFFLPTYSTDWPERINLEYWLDTDTGQSQYLARSDSQRLPASLAAAAHFDPLRRPRFAGSGVLAFTAAAPRMALAAPQLTVISSAAMQTPGRSAHFTIHVQSARAAPEVLLVFPAAAQIATVDFATANNSVRAKLQRLKTGATLLDIVGLPPAGMEFSVDAAGPLPLAVQVFDQSFDFPVDGNLTRARPQNATSSQDGDITVVHRTVSLDPRLAAEK